MRPDNLLFFAACSFVLGTVAGGLGIPPAGTILVLFAITPIFFILKLRLIALATIVLLFFGGNAYYAVDDYAYRQALRVAEKITSLEGRVLNDPRYRAGAQIAKVEVIEFNAENASRVRVYIRLESFPELSYGDLVRSTGDVVPPPSDSYGNYMAKEGMHGSMFYPNIEILGNDGNLLFERLFAIRHALKESLGRLFTQEQSAFLSGITIGDTDDFSKEFLEKLSVSGTLHLTALSGLNMTIIIFAALGIFSVVFWQRKRLQFTVTFSLVALFVAMTGFQVSAIRAALMAFLVGFAGITNRLYNPHNAIALAALLITLWNPKSAVFDLGFQLSFLATLSIIYFAPVLKLLPLLRTEGILGWRDVLAITLAAQLGVAPLSIINFGNFSFTSLLANIGILVVIPILTIMGFIVAFTTMIFTPLGHLLSKPIAFLIDYVIMVVNTFSVVYVPFNPEIGAVAALLYYAILVWICWRYSPALQRHETR